MSKTKYLSKWLGCLSVIWGVGLCPVLGATSRILPGHVPKAVARLPVQARLAATNELHLAIGLPLRDPAGLAAFLAQLHDPASPNYRKFLTPSEFSARFGPTEPAYAAVRKFAETNGFAITGTHGSRLALDVQAPAAAVEKAFHVTLHTYHHPKEKRDFFAPDTEPVVPAALPVQRVSGLDNYAVRRPLSVARPLAAMPTTATPHSGSGSGGSYLGNDFRAAYVPGTTLTGSGQSVALVQFDGYYSNDIAAYISQAGLTNYPVSLTNVAVNGGVTTPGSGNGEVCLDIEMVLSMAPGVSQIIVYEGPNSSTAWSTILGRIADDNLAKQISCSWGDTSAGAPDPTSEAIFQQMAAQGQSFFNASGDSDAFVGGIPFPSESTNITQVGGTTLSTTGPGGAWLAETAWNRGGGTGTGGGVSTHYEIPVWQQGINMTGNQGSTTMRNVPDVALTGEDVLVAYDNGSTAVFGGTSCAAPLWAGFMALVNELAASRGKPSAGFINPAIYTAGQGGNYHNIFHDTASGNNFWSSSPTNYPAVDGYDLCTGWGTPTDGLIAVLAGDDLIISPPAGYAISGPVGGPFSLASGSLLLTNVGTNSLMWSLANPAAWLDIPVTNGTLAAGEFTTLTAGLTATASNLAVGTYRINLWFTNETSQVVQTVPFSLQILDALAVFPTNGFTVTGSFGEAIHLASQLYTLTNLSTAPLDWSIHTPVPWLSVSTSSGTLMAGDQTSVTVSLTAAANHLPSGTNLATVIFSNLTSGLSLACEFSVWVQLPQLVTNGGFETGDFTGWTLANNTPNTFYYTYNDVYDSSEPGVVHAGTFGAALGDTKLMTLSQSVATLPGQDYLLSLWLDNSTSGSGQQFIVNWNTNPPTSNPVFSWAGSVSFDWTNLLFVVRASGTSTVLQIQAKNPPYFFGLDDVRVTPIPAPTFTDFGKTTNALSFTWDSLAGVAYQVQYQTNLLQTNWLVLANLTATGGSTSFTNTFDPAPQRFYRIRRLP